jgi:hypothetical protein
MSRRRQWGEDSTVSVGLSAGASVALSFKGNLFDLTASERQLMSDLANVIRAFRDAQSVVALEEEKAARA